MKRETLYDALTEVDDDLVEEAAVSAKRKKALRLRWIGAIAAALAVVLLVTAVLHPGGSGGLTAYAIETPVYPATVPYPDVSGMMSGGDFDEDALQASYEAWSEVWKQRLEARQNYSADTFQAYLTAAIPACLGGRPGENAACSPVNLYLALAMLAETTGGESRGQILSLLGTQDMDSLRTTAKNLFLANYGSDGASRSLLASAIWLRDGMNYRAETLKRLAETYYAASYCGEMGSESYDGLLRDWLNEQTGNRLADQVEGLGFDPDTVLALTTTVDFVAHWNEEFQPERTTDAVFHAGSGDEACRMMHRRSSGIYYWGERFGAMGLSLNDSGYVRFLLPDEGVTPEDLLSDPEALSFLLTHGYGRWANNKDLMINLSLPKFDVSSQLSLEQTLQGLGLTDVFDPHAADFSPLTDTEGVFLSEVKHGARVAVDEQGVTASAYTIMVGAGAAMPPDEEIDFTLDRPFLFVIYGPDDLPLFVGIVNHP